MLRTVNKSGFLFVRYYSACWVCIKSYEPSGKPYLADNSYFISISHTKGYVAVILSEEKPVGIDIEQYSRRVHKVAHKYMREDEQFVPYGEDDTWSLLLHWSAKEVMFKCMNTPEVDFREHLHIEPFTTEQQGGRMGVGKSV